MYQKYFYTKKDTKVFQSFPIFCSGIVACIAIQIQHTNNDVDSSFISLFEMYLHNKDNY